MATDLDEATKQIAGDLGAFAADMWAAQKRLEEKGFRVDGGNKTLTGWWLTASNRSAGPGGIKVQSDGTTIVVTAES